MNRTVTLTLIVQTDATGEQLLDMLTRQLEEGTVCDGYLEADIEAAFDGVAVTVQEGRHDP